MSDEWFDKARNIGSLREGNFWVEPHSVLGCGYMVVAMSKLEDTAYNYGAKIKGRAMSNLEHPRITEVGRLLAENDRLREDCAVFMASNAGLTNDVLELRAERDRLREALAGLLAIDENTEPLAAKAAWLRAEARMAKEVGK